MNMLKLLICILFFINIHVWGNDLDRATNKALEAISKTQTIKEYTNKLETKFFNIMPLEKDVMGYILCGASILIFKEVNTNNTNQLHISFQNLKIKPIIQLSDNGIKNAVQLNWNW